MLVWLLSLVLWFLFSIVKFVLWVVGLFLFCVWWCQGELLYLPNPGDRKETDRGPAFNPPGNQSPAEHGMDFEDHHVNTSDGVRVHLWFIKQPRVSTCPTILFFHGNASNIGFRLHNAKAMYEKLQANIVMVEYRGYGDSTGNPSEKGLMLDAQASLDWVRARSDVDPHAIYVFGRSLGGAVALGLCYSNQDYLRGVILENTFLSIDEMVVVLASRMLEQANVKFKYMSFARLVLRLYLTSHWKTDARASSIRVPVMFISGLADELIPPAHSAQLFKLCSPNCPLTTLFTVEGGGHNDTHMQLPVSNYYGAFRAFLIAAQSFVPAGPSDCELQRLNTGSS
jgi:fermentation-respiration switch protein FrsA (DUF1100 family)